MITACLYVFILLLDFTKNGTALPDKAAAPPSRGLGYIYVSVSLFLSAGLWAKGNSPCLSHSLSLSTGTGVRGMSAPFPRTRARSRGSLRGETLLWVLLSLTLSLSLSLYFSRSPHPQLVDLILHSIWLQSEYHEAKVW